MISKSLVLRADLNKFEFLNFLDEPYVTLIPILKRTFSGSCLGYRRSKGRDCNTPHYRKPSRLLQYPESEKPKSTLLLIVPRFVYRVCSENKVPDTDSCSFCHLHVPRRPSKSFFFRSSLETNPFHTLNCTPSPTLPIEFITWWTTRPVLVVTTFRQQIVRKGSTL